MRTLFLNPPSYEGFDGGAGARYQARREIRSYWYPTWLAQPAALVPDSVLVDAPPAGKTFADVVAMAPDFELAVLYTSSPTFTGDVKVAGAPLSPGDGTRPDSWSTMPNPTQDGPADEQETASGEDTATAEDTARDDAAEDTVVDRRKDRSSRGPFEPVDGNGADDGDTTARDEPYGDEPARP